MTSLRSSISATPADAAVASARFLTSAMICLRPPHLVFRFDVPTDPGPPPSGGAVAYELVRIDVELSDGATVYVGEW